MISFQIWQYFKSPILNIFIFQVQIGLGDYTVIDNKTILDVQMFPDDFYRF